MTHWQRPPGPLNVWKIVDGYENFGDELEKPVKFSIQEIPNEDERKKEVYNFLKTHFIANEPLCKSTNIKEDPLGIDCWMTLWKYGMDQGIPAGCYKLDSCGNIKELVGVHMVYIETKKSIEYFKKINSTCKSKGYKKILTLRERLNSKAGCLFEKYQVDKYLVIQSLAVNPFYQNRRLARHIVDTTPSICKKYGVHLTRVICSAATTQHLARLMNYEEVASIDYAEVVDDQQNPLFPNIKPKSAKLMINRFSSDASIPGSIM